MPCFTLPISEKGQLIITALVGDAGDGAEIKRLHQCHAMLDTGANASCVSNRLADKMQLTVRGKKEYASVSQMAAADLYRVNINIPFPPTPGEHKESVTFRYWNNVEVFGIPGVDQSFDVLLGMDLICHGALHVSGGQFTFCT